MSTLSSSSTLAEIQAAYDDNASYVEDDSTAKAQVFVTACRLLLRQTPKVAVHGGRGGREIQLSPELIRDEMRDAQQWLSQKSTAGRAKRFSLENFRA